MIASSNTLVNVDVLLMLVCVLMNLCVVEISQKNMKMKIKIKDFVCLYNKADSLMRINQYQELHMRHSVMYSMFT